MIVISDFEINQVASPNLPLSPMQYDRQYADQLNNVLRLYFNRVDAILDQLKTDNIVAALTKYTVATWSSSVTSGKGARSFVTDALLPTFGSTVAGGGAVAVPVYSDGTNWKVG